MNSRPIRILKLALLGVLAASLAHADVHEEKEEKEGGFYVSGSVGWNDDMTATFSGTSSYGTRIGESTLTSEEPLWDVAVGYSFRGLRIEGELTFTPMDVQDVSYVRFDGVPLDLVNQNVQVVGETSSKAPLPQHLLRFSIGAKWIPYLGLGVGVMGRGFGIDDSGL